MAMMPPALMPMPALPNSLICYFFVIFCYFTNAAKEHFVVAAKHLFWMLMELQCHQPHQPAMLVIFFFSGSFLKCQKVHQYLFLNFLDMARSIWLTCIILFSALKK